ncbi:MAG: RIP metalloprotease RseP [Peptoniphilaceae bacterium]|nr:RIP metalloprotease RseP [Peptoniphilaceae bacterium]MDY6085549.1 RIP metalloprotease RseP [Peptoniphilaceae bacterium]
MNIIVALIVFMIVILFHEGGHFFAAKKVGIRVNEFSVGMGPALWQTQKGETTYSLRALPLGGYCAMEGEEEDSDVEGSYSMALPWQRFLTVLAGPVMNLVIAYLCFALFLGLSGKPVPVVDSFSKNSPAAEVGMLPGDRITAINGQTVDTADEMTAAIQEAGKDDEIIAVTYLRDNETTTVRLRPQEQEGRLYVGIVMQRKADPLGAITGGVSMLVDTFVSLFVIIGRLITGGLSADAISGPVGVISLIGQAASQGFTSVIYLTGYISVNLAFFNLLPIPALDGFTLLLIIIEKLRGKPLKQQVEERIKIVGFSLLMGLILFVSFKDVIRLF